MATAPNVPEPTKLWRPHRVLLTRSARTFAHGREIAERASALGVPVVELPTDRLNLDVPDDPRCCCRTTAT